MRPAVFLAATLAALPAHAQFTELPYDLATTPDGSALYFTVPAPPGGNEQIFRWTPATETVLFADRSDLSQGTQLPARLYGTQLTSGGAVVYHAELACPVGPGGASGNHCPIGQTVIVGPHAAPLTLAGYLLISPNGRYGVFAPYKPDWSTVLWVDWNTGDEIEVGLAPGSLPATIPGLDASQHGIANNGSFLIRTGTGLKVWSPAGIRVLPLGDTPTTAALSADGSTVGLPYCDRGSLHPPACVIDVASGRITHFPPGGVSLSADGQTIAYLTVDPQQPPYTNARAMVARTDLTEPRAIANSPDGVRSVLLSGDGRVLYVVTGAVYPGPFHLLRYELDHRRAHHSRVPGAAAPREIPPAP